MFNIFADIIMELKPFSSCQRGFLPNHSVQTAIIMFGVGGIDVCAVFCVLKKAFDSIPHVLYLLFYWFSSSVIFVVV